MNLLARLLSVTFISALCMTQAHATSDPRGSNTAKMIDIAPNTVDCFGVGPMKCLVVDGELFYGQIQGYNHTEGLGTNICVEISSQNIAGISDRSSQSYRQVPGSECVPIPTPPVSQPKSFRILSIGANEVTCHGVGPRSCLLVDGELFYDKIAGVTSMDKLSIFVLKLQIRAPRTQPIQDRRVIGG